MFNWKSCYANIQNKMLSNFSFQAFWAISNVLSEKADVNEIIRGWISEETTETTRILVGCFPFWRNQRSVTKCREAGKYGTVCLKDSFLCDV